MKAGPATLVNAALYDICFRSLIIDPRKLAVNLIPLPRLHFFNRIYLGIVAMCIPYLLCFAFTAMKANSNKVSCNSMWTRWRLQAGGRSVPAPLFPAWPSGAGGWQPAISTGDHFALVIDCMLEHLRNGYHELTICIFILTINPFFG